jgi:cold shock CspA family protein
MRIGVIKFVAPQKGFGFIYCQGLSTDVFFDFTAWKSTTKRADRLVVGDEVEFDLDELSRIRGDELKAEKVIPSRRPLSTKLADDADPHMLPKHHPKARRRMATWRQSDKPKQTPEKNDDESELM